jgi:hypothetical protein
VPHDAVNSLGDKKRKGEDLMIRNVNRVDHIAGVVRRENFSAVIERMSHVFETTFDGPFDRAAMGALMATSLDAGIELLAPRDDDPENPFNKMLTSRGEHWISVVMGVRDIDASCAQLARLGYKPVAVKKDLAGKGDYPARLTRLEQALFGPGVFGGLGVSICYSEEAGGAA